MSILAGQPFFHTFNLKSGSGALPSDSFEVVSSTATLRSASGDVTIPTTTTEQDGLVVITGPVPDDATDGSYLSATIFVESNGQERRLTEDVGIVGESSDSIHEKLDMLLAGGAPSSGSVSTHPSQLVVQSPKTHSLLKRVTGNGCFELETGGWWVDALDGDVIGEILVSFDGEIFRLPEFIPIAPLYLMSGGRFIRAADPAVPVYVRRGPNTVPNDNNTVTPRV